MQCEFRHVGSWPGCQEPALAYDSPQGRPVSACCELVPPPARAPATSATATASAVAAAAAAATTGRARRGTRVTPAVPSAAAQLSRPAATDRTRRGGLGHGSLGG